MGAGAGEGLFLHSCRGMICMISGDDQLVKCSTKLDLSESSCAKIGARVI